MSHGVQSLLRIARNTADLDRAMAFYRDALRFQAVMRAAAPAWTRLPGVDAIPARTAWLSLGSQCIELTEFPDAAPYLGDSAACDLWFQHCAVVVDDMPHAHDLVLQHGAVPITRGGPQTLPPSTGAITAFKFRDPDGHPLELLHFPGGSGDPARQSPRRRAAVPGIDHTAISVGDARRSVLFYQLLGCTVAAQGINRGVEQQRLDDLDAVEVGVVAMQAGSAPTPRLELLGYRQPRGRANRSRDPAAISADRTVWQAETIDVLLDGLDDAGFTDTIVASGVIEGATVALLRDPDGHLLVLHEMVPGTISGAISPLAA